MGPSKFSIVRGLTSEDGMKYFNNTVLGWRYIFISTRMPALLLSLWKDDERQQDLLCSHFKYDRMTWKAENYIIHCSNISQE